LPETYVLYDGPANQRDLRRALDAWTWAAGPIGEYYPLLMYNLPAEARAQVDSYRSEFELDETVRLLAEVSARQLGALYRGATVVFSPAPGPAWGNPLRRALAAGKPVVGIEERATAALLGPAGYLIPQDDLRRLGAAVITVIVEEQVAESLSQAAIQRASNWQKQAFVNRLAQVYSRVLV
jgi:glycosyltransferase involved in cell wall biosynthesis